MKTFLKIAAFFALGLAAGVASAQTNTATATLTVTAAKVAAHVSITPPSVTAQQGAAGTMTITVSNPNGSAVPTGTAELLSQPPGATAYTLVNTFTLVNGVATCSYPVPATAPVGTYNVEGAYSGDGTFLPSAAFR